jgi:hypothetical protein
MSAVHSGRSVEFEDIVMNMTIARQRFDKHRLKPGIVEEERKSVASQRLAKHTLPLQRVDPLLVNGSVNAFRGSGKTE